MADLKKTIDIIFNSVDNATGGIRNINSGIAAFETHVTNVTGPIADLTTKVLKYEAVVLGLAAAYAGFSIGAAANFESAQISLAKVLNGDADSVTAAMKEASTEAIELSERYGISSSTILEGMAQFKQSGFTAKEAAILQKDAMDLVIAGGVNAATATNLLTRSLIGFKAGAEDAGRFTEALNNVSNKYNTNLELLALGMSKISPIASLMNFSFEETTGLLTPIIEVFGTGREAAIALKTGLLKLVDDSPKVQKALADLGVSQFDLNGEMRTGRDIFFDVAKSFETLDEKQKIAFTSQIVGIEQAGRMAVVFGNLALVNEVTATAMAETGSVAKEVGLRLDSTNIQIKRTIQGFSNLSAEIGEKMLPGFDDANEGIRALQKSFRLVVQDGGLSPIFDAINKEGADFEIFLKEIAEALPEAFTELDFTGIIASFGNLKDAISGLFGDVDLTTPEGLAETLQGVIEFLELMITATAGVVRGFEPFIEGLTTVLEKLSDFDPDNQEFIGFIAGTITGIDKIIPILGFFASALALLGTVITALVSLKFLKFLGGIALGLGRLTPLGRAVTVMFGLIEIAASRWVGSQDGVTKSLAESNIAISKMALDIDKLSAATGDSTITFANYQEKLAEFADSTAEAAAEATVFGEKLDTTGVNFRNLDEIIKLSTEINSDWTNGVKSSNEALSDSITNVINLGNASGRTNEEIQKLLDKHFDFSETVRQGGIILGDYLEFNSQFPDVIDKVADSTEKSTKKFGKLTEAEELAAKQTAALEIELEKIASNEKIAAMEFTADIKVAQFEAQSEQIVAQLEAMAAGLESNNALVGELFSHEAPNWDKFGFATEAAIEAANSRANELNKSIVDMNEAQVNNLNAQTKLLREGGSEITINADNLAPELQKVLEALIDNIRIQAVQQGLEILL